MDKIEKTTDIDNVNITLITNYLEDNYVILNNTFINKVTNKSEWGHTIIESLIPILSIDEKFITKVVKWWVLSKGMSDDKWDNSFISVILNTKFDSLKQIELEQIIGINAEKQMITLLSEQIAKEIDSEILRQLKKKVTGVVEFENLMKCLGYVLTPTMYNPNTFKPFKKFLSITEYDKIYEQQNNPYWKDWFRARRQDEKT